MRRSLAWLLAGAFVLVPAGITAAGRLPWRGEFALDLIAPGFSPLIATGTGLATLNASSGGSHLSRLRLSGGITGSAAVPVTDPLVTAGGLIGIEATFTLGTGSLAVASASGQRWLSRATLPLGGVLRLCLLDPACSTESALSLPLTADGGGVGLGVGGLLTVGGFHSNRVSLIASPWTVGTVLVPVGTSGGATFAIPAAGWLHGPLSFTTSTALPGGALSLVTPVRVSSTWDEDITGFGRLTLRLVPEPAALVLLAPGLVGLLVLGRARTRA